MTSLDQLLMKLGKRDVNTNINDFAFFTEESSEGIFSKEEYRDYISKSPGWHIKHLKTLHDNMRLGRKINGMPTTQYENGQEFIWCRFNYGNVRQNIKIINKGRMLDFINDYSLGKIRNVQSLEELLQAITEN